jgi:hypothetical protein
MSAKPVLFLDANQYLDLYRMPRGKQILAALNEQKEYIFVTRQVVEEVNRGKVKVAAIFLGDLLKTIELNAVPVPDHILNSTDSKLEALSKRLAKAREEFSKIKQESRRRADHFLREVSQSKDEVSKALEDIFSKPVPPTPDEVDRAKERKIFGHPPGKYTDPLGDQLSWEQILTKCKDGPKLWILTRDSDYAIRHDGKMYLNARLYEELGSLYQTEPEVFCFDTMAEGLKHFSENAEVKANRLPTPTETEQIKQEQESLPPLGWLVDSTDALSTAIRNANMNRLLMTDAVVNQNLSTLANSIAKLPPAETYYAGLADAIAKLPSPEMFYSRLADSIARLPSPEAFYARLADSVAKLPSPEAFYRRLADSVRKLPSKGRSDVPNSADASEVKSTSEGENDSPDESKAKNEGG